MLVVDIRWENVRTQLKNDSTKDQFEYWFASIHLEAIRTNEGGTVDLLLSVPTIYVCKLLNTSHFDQVFDICKVEYPNLRNVVIKKRNLGSAVLWKEPLVKMQHRQVAYRKNFW